MDKVVFEEGRLSNYSYVTGSQPSSLTELDDEPFERGFIGSEIFNISIATADISEENETYYSAQSSLESLSHETLTCVHCEEDAGARTILQHELNETKKQMEKLCEVVSRQKEEYEALSINEDDANAWLKVIGNSNNYKYNDNLTRITVKQIVLIMKKFENNENIAGRVLDILNVTTGNSELAVQYLAIIPGVIRQLMSILKENAEHMTIDYALYHILIRIAECSENAKELVKSEYIMVFLKEFSKNVLDYAVFYSATILVQLLDFPSDCFPEEITKENLEIQIIKLTTNRLEQLSEIRGHSFVSSYHYRWYTDKLVTGTYAQKCLCAFLFVCASNLVKNPKDKTTLQELKDDGVIRVMEKVAADPVTDEFVKRLVDIALQELNKTKS